MKITRRIALDSINPGRTSAYEEAEDKAYASTVFVESENRDRLLSPDKHILLLVGGKGSGKTTLYLHLLSNSPTELKHADGTSERLVCAFVNAARANCHEAVDAFSTLASHVHAHSDAHSIPVARAFKAIDPVRIQRNWLHILAYDALKAITGVLSPPDQALVPKRVHDLLREYSIVYGLIDSPRLIDRVAKWFARHVTRRKMKLRFTIPVIGADVEFEESELAPRDVFEAIDEAMQHLGGRLYIIVDTADEILGRDYEEVALCLLSSFMDVAVNWHEWFRHISLKLLIRADFAMRAEYNNKDRIVDRYAVIRWNKEQFLRLMLKRLLYSDPVRELVGFAGDISILDHMASSELERWFELLFGRSKSIIHLNCLSESDPAVVANHRDGMLPHDFLHRYFMDGKQSIALRHIVSFLDFCKGEELRRCAESQDNGRAVSADSPLFHQSTLEKAAFVVLPGFVLQQINQEYPFLRSKFGDLACFCEKRFAREEVLACIREIGPAAPETEESVFRALFYSGLMGGDAALAEHCERFYLPVFVSFALKGGHTKKALATTE